MRANYVYKGRLANGDLVTGDLVADGVGDLAEQLERRGITPIDMKVGVEVNFSRYQAFLRPWPTPEEMVLFTRQLQTLVRARVPIIRSLQGVGQGLHNHRLREAIGAIVERLESGDSLSESMARHPKLFPPLYYNMVQIGEQTGRLEETLERLYRFLEFDNETRKAIKSALRYPSFVIGFAVAALVIVTYYIIPQFTVFYSQMKIQLPWQTVMLMDVSGFMKSYIHLILIGGVAFVVLWLRYIHSRQGDRWWSEQKFKLPVVGSIIKRGTLARFARAFAMGSRSGVPVIQTLSSVSFAVDNRYVGAMIEEIIVGIERGETLVQSAYRTRLFPPLVIQMLAVGEETGSMDQMMEDVAFFYEREVEYDIKGLSAAMEPIILAILGAMVLVLAMGVLLPMWDIVQAVKK